MKLTKKITSMMMIMILTITIMSINVEANENPTIRLSISNYDPMPAQPGQFVDVWLNIQNTGRSDARDLKIEFKESPFFELVNPEDKTKEIPVIGSFKDNIIRYRFKVSDDVVEGTNQLRFEYTHRNQPGITTVNLNIEVKSTESPISISSARITPDPVEPGKKSTLTVAATNPSTSSNLRDVSLTLQLVNPQTGEELPFSPVDSTNKKSINRIRPGQTTEFKFNLVTHPDAESKIYKVPVTTTYFDDTGNRYEETMFISMNVNSNPDVYAIIESININKAKRTGEINFDVINQGLSDIKLLTVKLEETEQLTILSPSNKNYLGNLESDDFKSARFRVRVSEEIEEITLPLTLMFRDALNNEFTENIEITHKLREPETNGNGTGTIIIVLIILGIIGIIYYRRKQKRKKLVEED